jgi:integrase
LANLWFVEPLGLDSDWNTSKFSSVNKWIKIIRRRGDSRATKKAYFNCLATFMRTTGMDPDQIVALSPEKAKEAIQDFCDGYAAKKKYRTAHLYLNCLRSFLRHNGKKDLDLDDMYAWKRSKRPERVPTRDEVYRMAEVSDLRDKAAILCDFQSGLRNATLRALTYGDIKEQIQSDAPIISIHVTPHLKERVPEACKENVEHFTFFGKKATEALRVYLEERKSRYGPIGADEPVLRSHSNIPDAKARSRPITEDALERLVKKAARRAGIKEWEEVRFHSLRKTFRAVLDAGFIGGGGQLAEDDKEYLIGHVLPGQKAPYHNANVQVLQERYSKLDWGGEPAAPSTKFERLKQYAKDLGFDPDGIIEEQIARKLPRKVYKGHAPGEEKRRTMTLPTEEEMTSMLQAGLRERLAMNAPSRRTAHNGGTPIKDCPYETRIVGEKELVPFLDQGWDVVRELTSGRIIIRRANHLDE